MCETKLSPRIENGFLKWYKGDTFSFFIDLTDAETQEPLVLNEDDKVLFEIVKSNRLLALVYSIYKKEEGSYECHIDNSISRFLDIGYYKYRIVIDRVSVKTRQTVENCGDIEVEGVCKCDNVNYNSNSSLLTNSNVKIKVTVRTAGAKLDEKPFEITENGVYEVPKGVLYNPIIVTAKAKDEPLTITENNKEIIAPDGIRYNPIQVAIPEKYQEKVVVPTKEEQVVGFDEGYTALSQVIVEPIPDEYVLESEITFPTLNAPEIALNPNGGYLYIRYGNNGDFVKEYQLYLNGEQTATFTERNILLQDYGITETDEIGIVATGDLFNNSPMSRINWNILTEGTIGLTYKENAWTGIGTATGNDITVASIVNGYVITTMSYAIPNNATMITYRLADSISKVTSIFSYSTGNANVIFGASIADIATVGNTSRGNTCIFDFRKAQQVPVFGGGFHIISQPLIIVPDHLYDEWIVATNWSKYASRIIKASNYEVQQGE